MARLWHFAAVVDPPSFRLDPFASGLGHVRSIVHCFAERCVFFLDFLPGEMMTSLEKCPQCFGILFQLNSSKVFSWNRFLSIPISRKPARSSLELRRILPIFPIYQRKPKT